MIIAIYTFLTFVFFLTAFNLISIFTTGILTITLKGVLTLAIVWMFHTVGRGVLAEMTGFRNSSTGFFALGALIAFIISFV